MGLWCGCGAHWPPRKMGRLERRHCVKYRGDECSLETPCAGCVAARARAVDRVGRDFEARGVWAQAALTENV
jgi:hypothetical protein